jgi:hypothetical protein
MLLMIYAWRLVGIAALFVAILSLSFTSFSKKTASTESACGEVVETADHALRISVMAMVDWDKIRSDLSNTNSLLKYVNMFSNCCSVELDDLDGYWLVNLTLPTQEGDFFDWVMRVRMCGGKLIPVASAPTFRTPDICVSCDQRDVK